jgi:hypothetical protein
LAKQEGRTKTKTEVLREAPRRYGEERRWRALQRYGAGRARKVGMKEKPTWSAPSRSSAAAGSVPRIVADTNIHFRVELRRHGRQKCSPSVAPA